MPESKVPKAHPLKNDKASPRPLTPAGEKLWLDAHAFGLETVEAWKASKDTRLVPDRRALAKQFARAIWPRFAGTETGLDTAFAKRVVVKAARFLSRNHAPLSAADIARIVEKKIEDARFIRGLVRERMQSGPLVSDRLGAAGPRFLACLPAENLRVGRDKAFLETVSSKTLALGFRYVESDRRSCAVIRVDLDLAKHGIDMPSLGALYSAFEDLVDAGAIVDYPNLIVPECRPDGSVLSAHVLWLLPEGSGVWCDQDVIDDPDLPASAKPKTKPIRLFRAVYKGLCEALAHLGADASAPGMCPRMKNPLCRAYRTVSWSARFHTLSRWAEYLDLSNVPSPETAPLPVGEGSKLIEGSLTNSLFKAMQKAAYAILTNWHLTGDERWVEDKGLLGYHLTEELELLFGDVDTEDDLEKVRDTASNVGHFAALKFDIRRTRCKNRGALAEKVRHAKTLAERQSIAAAESAVANRKGTLGALFEAFRKLDKFGPFTKADLARAAGVCRQTVYNCWPGLQALLAASRRLPSGCLKRCTDKKLGAVAALVGAVAGVVVSVVPGSASPAPAVQGAPVVQAASPVVSLPSQSLSADLDVRELDAASSSVPVFRTGSAVPSPDGPAPTSSASPVIDLRDSLDGAVQGSSAKAPTSKKKARSATPKGAKPKGVRLSRRAALDAMVSSWSALAAAGEPPTIAAVSGHAGVTEAAVAGRWVDLQFAIIQVVERRAKGTVEGSLPRRVLAAVMAEASGGRGDADMLAQAARWLSAPPNPYVREETLGRTFLGRLARSGRVPHAMDSTWHFLGEVGEDGEQANMRSYRVALLRERWEAYRDGRPERPVSYAPFAMGWNAAMSAGLIPENAANWAASEPAVPAPLALPAPALVFSSDEDDDSDDRDLAALDAHDFYRESTRMPVREAA